MRSIPGGHGVGSGHTRCGFAVPSKVYRPKYIGLDAVRGNQVVQHDIGLVVRKSRVECSLQRADELAADLACVGGGRVEPHTI